MSGSLDRLLTRNPIQSFSMMRQICGSQSFRKKNFHGIQDHLRINRTLKAINFADQDLHVYESLDGADDGGDDPHGLVRGDGDAVNVTWGQIIVLESFVKITEFSNNYMFTGFYRFS